MTAIAHALLAISAAGDGDGAAARAHIATAQRHSRTSARRHRQVVEIAALVIAEQRERAGGLALIHAAEFPNDADLLARVTTNAPAKGLTPDANATTAGSPSVTPSTSPTSPSPSSGRMNSPETRDHDGSPEAPDNAPP